MRQVSSLSPCLCSYKLVPFKIAHCKDNCASRCCYKVMTVVTLKFRKLLKRVKQRTSSANLWCMFVESKTELNVVFKIVLFLNNATVLNLLLQLQRFVVLCCNILLLPLESSSKTLCHHRKCKSSCNFKIKSTLAMKIHVALLIIS